MQWASKNEARRKWLCLLIHWKDLNGTFLLEAPAAGMVVSKHKARLFAE